MSHKRTWGLKLFLIILGIVIFIVFAGLIIELISKLGILKDTPVPIRTSPIPVLILSLAYISSGVLLFIQVLKAKPKIIILWNIFAGLTFLLNLYKIIFPTYLVSLIPFYSIISSLIIIAIWYSIFRWLKRKSSEFISHSSNS